MARATASGLSNPPGRSETSTCLESEHNCDPSELRKNEKEGPIQVSTGPTLAEVCDSYCQKSKNKTIGVYRRILFGDALPIFNGDLRVEHFSWDYKKRMGKTGRAPVQADKGRFRRNGRQQHQATTVAMEELTQVVWSRPQGTTTNQKRSIQSLSGLWLNPSNQGISPKHMQNVLPIDYMAMLLTRGSFKFISC